RSAAPSVRVGPAELSVPGVDLFSLIEPPAPGDEDSEVKLVGVVGGADGKLVEGRDLMRAVADVKPDRKTLARVALAVAQRQGELLDAATTSEQRKARVRPPTITDNALTFWVWTTDVPRSLERGKVDLATGAVDIAPPPMPRDAMIARAIATLGGVSILRHPAAIRTLADACSDPKARQALVSALASHPRARSRMAIADQIHRCGAAAVDPLINAMEQDKAAMVRSQAAIALGRIGDSRARPSLAKAARSEDANLVWAAKNALGKIQ
ncbi:MAG TPA: HEAT repeat domain-containing protein, partial [Kofleriaceae bacterium]|nr:HEAT repeat domain-containing protein [Kofleriaceae bacterium]